MCRWAVVLTLVCAAAPGQAQRLFGTVVLADGRTPGSGAIVAATDSSGAVVAREMASSRGDYVMPLSAAGTFTLTAWRVGSEPEVVRGVVVGAGSDVRQRIVMARPAPRPPRVSARTGETCELGAATSAPATLWDQLQTALATTAMAEQTRLFVASWTLAQRQIDGNLRDTISRKDSPERMNLEVPIMPTLPPDSSRRRGFVIERPQGVMYHVPGVATLRSASFIEARCFALEPAPADRPTWIGLHFRPSAVRTGLSDIEGTVWFDSASLEPQRLDYSYLGLPPTFAPARPGGSIAFRRVATGHWVADEWTIRVPSGRYIRMFAYDTREVPSGYGNFTLEGVQVTTATLRVLEVNGAPIYRRP